MAQIATLTATLLVVALPSFSLDPSRTLAQSVHDFWGVKQGFLGGSVNAIAQTSDGYLWIGAENGLVRFDGITFRLFDYENADSFPRGPVLGLQADREGGLFIRMHSPGLVRYHNGSFDRLLPQSSDTDGVTALGKGVNGNVLLGRSGDPLRYDGKDLRHALPSKDVAGGLDISITETADRTLWIGTRDAGLMAFQQGRRFKLDGLPDRKINCLLPGKGVSLWIGTDYGLVQWVAGKLNRPQLPKSLSHAEVLALVGDHDGNVWAGTTGGLVRVDPHGTVSQEPFGSATPASVNAVFEDREGSLWVGRASGIERFRDTDFLSFPAAMPSASANSGGIFADLHGRLWFGPSSGGLCWLQGKKRSCISGAGLPKDVVYSISGGLGELWVGRRERGVTLLREERGNFKAITYTTANGLAKGPVYAIHRGRDGSVWAGTLAGGVSVLRNGAITTYTTLHGKTLSMITALEETPDGTIWIATLNGLVSFARGTWQIYSGQDGLPPARINCLSVDSAGALWIGTEAGVAVWNDGRIVTPASGPDVLQGNVLGIADDGLGFLWISTNRHIVRVRRSDLLNKTVAKAELRDFGASDGLPGTEGLQRSRSVVKDSSGLIWFSLQSGLCMVDPARVPLHSSPAIVHLESIALNGRRIKLGQSLRISANQQRIALDYIGLSLTAPENVRYRYRLDGFDHDWSEPSSSRQAIYTNLDPGTYRFRVVASNSERIWNSSEAVAVLEIVPQLWQTRWFQIGAAAAMILLLITAYRLRLHQLEAWLNLRFEERLAERTRIAQELHDTLLQGFMSASMQIHVATEATPDHSPAKPVLIRALRLMQQVIEEGRNAVRGLRSVDQVTVSLEEAFLQIQPQLGPENDKAEVQLHVFVNGEAQPLHPLLRDEVYRIGREAVTNAFRHARANKIEVELTYSSARFHLVVRDDGIGFHPKILDQGGDRHWGLIGMRERAERIGAHLRISSRESAGTEIQLDLPGHLAFREQVQRKRLRFRA